MQLINTDQKTGFVESELSKHYMLWNKYVVTKRLTAMCNNIETVNYKYNPFGSVCKTPKVRFGTNGLVPLYKINACSVVLIFINNLTKWIKSKWK